MISAAGKGSKRAATGPVPPHFEPGTPCLLAKLTDPRIGGWAPGLAWEDGDWVVDRRIWRCCGGTGLREVVHRATVSSCDLMARVKLVRSVQAHHVRMNGGGPPIDIRGDSTGLGAFLVRWGQIAKGETHMGLSFGAADIPHGSIWSLALAAAWRFGLMSLVASLDSPTAEDVIYQRRVGGSQLAIFVDGSIPMWDPQVIDRMERLIHFCYGGLIPLFLLMPAQTSAAPAAHQMGSGRIATSSQFAARLAKAKSRPMVEALAPDARAKLREVTAPIRRTSPPPTGP